MNLSVKKCFIFVLLCSHVFSAFLYAQSAQSANRKTAVRYLKLCEQYASQKNWQAADSNAEIGLAYDDSISDLWYIRSVSKTMTGVPKYQIIPFIQKALTFGQWVDYNKESARVLYADILCSVREFDQALTVLNQEPFIYSADAEYIRAKSLYNLGTVQALDQARDKIDAARRIYPDDQRFAELFFRYEYALGGRSEKNAKTADSFINSVSLYKKPSADLEIYAAIFAEGERKIRMLKSFNARGLKSPLYAVAALEEETGLLTEEKALDYFYSFADKSVDFSLLLKFSQALKDKECRREFGEYLNQYSGIIYKDTDGDLTYNLKVEYMRGRPQKISYDSTQDDLDDWTCECDFGVPVVLHLTQGAVDAEYGEWPYVSRVSYRGEEPSSTKLSLSLVAEELAWSPFLITADETVKNALGIDFFVPVIPEKTPEISDAQLIKVCSFYTMPSKERKNAYIKVSVLDGKAQIARYYTGETMYAQTQFEKGLPVLRTVDMDGDGLFETTETYGFDPENAGEYITKNDEVQIMVNLFGTGDSGTGFYVKMIQIDRNGDTIPDFTEEYSRGLGKISSWDLDNDGNWDVQYIKSPVSADGVLVETARYYEPLKKSLVTVTTKNGIPSSVTENDVQRAVVKAAKHELYWIGEAGSSEDAQKILKSVNHNSEQGVCIIVENKGRRMLAVRIGKYIFGQLLPNEEIILEKVETN